MRISGRTVRLLSRCVAVAVVFSALTCWSDDLEFERGRMREMLRIVSSEIQKNFYDPQLKGLNWAALTDEARQKIDKATTPSEMLTAIFVLVDRLQDSHTKFIPPARAARPLFGFEAKAFGDDIRIYTVKRNSAAEAAGLKVGDRIVGVNGYGAERNSFDLMMLYFRLLRPVTQMVMQIQRGGDPVQTITVKAKIKQEARQREEWRQIDDIWRLINEDDAEKYYSFTSDSVGYVRIPSFAAEDLSGPFNAVHKSKAVIVDLRGNGGGYQETLLTTAGFFEKAPTTMGDWVGRKKTEALKIKPHGPSFDAPVVVLIDSHSASAAEMFARHLQRTGKAIILGDRSSGRVNSSRFHTAEIGGESVVPFAVQISEGRVVFPGGEELEKKGVVPDQYCVPSGNDLQEGDDVCLLWAFAAARKKLGLSEELPPSLVAEVHKLTAKINEENSRPQQ